MNNGVEMVRVVENRVSRGVPVRWPECRGWRRGLLAVARWLLRIAHAEPSASVEHTKSSTVSYDGESIIQRLELSRHDIYRIWCGEAKHVVVGRADAEKLFGEMDQYAMFSFPLRARYSMDEQIRVLGLTLHVIPWMEGVLLLPDLKEVSPLPNLKDALAMRYR